MRELVISAPGARFDPDQTHGLSGRVKCYYYFANDFYSNVAYAADRAGDAQRRHHLDAC